MENPLLLSIENSFKAFSQKDFLVFVDENGSQIRKTYFEFENDVHRLSHYFTTIKSKNLVTINGNNYVHIVQILSALISGKTLTLISPEDHPSQQKQKLEKLAADSIVLQNSYCANQVAGGASHKTSPTVYPEPTEIAIQVFTSGSTGYGKVVCLTYDNILSNIRAVATHHRLGTQDTIATSLPVFHVNCLFFSYLSSFISGCKFILFERFDFLTFSEVIERESATIVSVVPTLVSILCRSSKWMNVNDFNKVKYFVSAASYLSPQLMKQFSECFDKKIIQGYGLSEVVNFSLTMPISILENEEKYWKIAIDLTNTCAGQAILGNDVQVLNDDFEECSENQIGQICIRGASVMKYYKDDLQKSSFHDGFFCTGDLGYYKQIASARYFYISGRKKDIIKRNGVTISLREIDDQLAQLHINQKDIISLGFRSEISGEEIGLVVEVDKNFQIEKHLILINSYIADHFSSQAQPSAVLFTTSKIRTPSGKPMRFRFLEKFEGVRPSHQNTLFVMSDLG